MTEKTLFISYSSEDRYTVWPLVDNLEHRLHTRCWIDKEKIKVGEDFVNAIYEGIDNADAVLFMLSDNSIASEWTRKEIDHASETGKRIIPLVIDGKGLRDWASDVFGRIDYVDVNKPEKIDKLVMNLKEWYPNIENTAYLKMSRDYLKDHPKETSYAVRYLSFDDEYSDMRVVSLTGQDVEKIRECVSLASRDRDLNTLVQENHPEVYEKIKPQYDWLKVVKVDDLDKHMIFVNCDVAVFDDGVAKDPKRLKVPVSMTAEEYEELLAWKLEWRGRDLFDLSYSMPYLAQRIISDVKTCRYCQYHDGNISHPFALEIEELEKDAFEILGERELDSIIYDGREDEYSEFFCMVGEWYQTILQIFEKNLIFGVNSSRGCYMIEVADAIAVQNAMKVTRYKEIERKIREEFGGEFGVATFKGWLEGNGISYEFIDGDCPNNGELYYALNQE